MKKVIDKSCLVEEQTGNREYKAAVFFSKINYKIDSKWEKKWNHRIKLSKR